MKNNTLLALAATTAALTGCGNEDSPPKAPAPPPVPQVAPPVESRAQLSAESTELKAELARLQAADPSVKDLYYGVDEAGNRVLHVVRETPNATAESSIWPLVGGMAIGALIGSMISSGGVNNYARQHPPTRTSSYYSREDERRQRNSTTARYNESLQKRLTPVTAAPVRPAAEISTRSSSVFSGSSSSRSSSYSGGS